MKKIFLTSGLVLCMACPAFAAGSGFTQTESTAADLTIEDACVEPKLGVYEGPTTLKAKWSAIKGHILFNNNAITLREHCATDIRFQHQSTDANWASIFTAPNPTELWTVYDGAVYGTQADRDAGTNPITALTSTPVLTGYEFGGYWNTDDNGFRDYMDSSPAGATNDSQISGTKWIDENGRFAQGLENYPTTSTDVYLQARWTPKEYTITYNCGSAGSTTVAPIDENDVTQSIRFDDCYSLLNVTDKCSVPTSEEFGYTFGGWSCTPNLPNATKTLPADATAAANGYPANTAVASLYAAGAGGAWTLDGNATCTAIWVGKKIGITWNDNDGDNTTTATGGTSSCFYGTDVTLPTAPTRNGYTFGGWEVVSNPSTAEPQNP